MTYPILVAPSANNWRDHFSGASLDPRWGTILSGTGSATVTDSYVELNTGGLNSAAALYLAAKLDKTKSQLLMAAISFPTDGAVAGFAPYVMALANGATTPAPDTKNNWLARVIGHRSVSNQSSLAILDDYFDASNATHFWDGKNASPAFTPTFSTALASQMPVQDDDFYISGVEIDGPNSRFRWVGWGQAFATPNTFITNQGWQLQSLTDWIPWASTRDSSNIWLIIGTPFNNDPGSAHVCRVGWARYSEAVGNTLVDAWTAQKDLANSISGKIRHHTSVDGEIFLPEDRSTWAIDVGTGWEAQLVQEPWGVYDGASTDYLFYQGSDVSSVQSIGVASAAHASPQVGPWTKFGSNPIISVGSSGANDDNQVGFPWVVCDQMEPNSAKRWKMLYAGKKTSDSKWRTLYATAATPTGPWTKQGTALDVGTAGANDETAARDVVAVFYNGLWYVFYEAWDASGVTHLMYATGTDLAALTKQGTYWSPAATSTDQALTAAMTTAPGRTVVVGSSAGFAQDQTVVFSQSTALSTFVTSRVRKIVDAVTVELYHGLTGLTSSYPARMKAMVSSANMSPRAIVWTGAEWWWHINFWEPFLHQSYSASYSNVIEEGHLAKHANASPVGAAFAFDGLASPPVSRSVFNGINSNENLTLLNVPFALPATPSPLFSAAMRPGPKGLSGKIAMTMRAQRFPAAAVVIAPSGAGYYYRQLQEGA